MSGQLRQAIAPTLLEVSGPGGWLSAPAFPAILGTVGCFPLLIVHFQQLWSRSHYQYFPLVLVAVIALYQLRRSTPVSSPPRPRIWLSRLALIGGLLLATYAVLRISPLLCCVAWLLTVMAFVARAKLNLWAAWALLCLLLRLPQGRDVQLIQWLQRVSTSLSSRVLDLLHIDHFPEGNVLTFPDRKLFVEEACSGVVSLFTIVATAAILGAFLRRTVFHTVLLMAAGAFWAGAANVLRIVAIAVFLEMMGIDLTHGWPHDFLGLAIFGVTLATLCSTDAMLRFLFGPVEVDEENSSGPIEGNPLVRLWNGLFWPLHERPVALLDMHHLEPLPTSGKGWKGLTAAASGGFLMLGALQVWGGIGPFSNGLGVAPSVVNLSKQSLPSDLAGWTLTDFRRETRSTASEFGEHSRQWTFRRGEQTLVASLDFPFPEWHDLDVCYRGVGWETTLGCRLPDQSTAVQYRLQKDLQAGWLIFDLFDQEGRPYQLPPGSGIHPRWRRLISGDASRWTLPTYYQVQVLAVQSSSRSLAPASSTDFQPFFVAFRERLHREFHSPQSGDQP